MTSGATSETGALAEASADSVAPVRSAMARHQEIEQWLRQLVLGLSPGSAIPSESELAAQFGVSRMTARQAVQDLARDGLVRRQRGAGTFVAPQPMHRREGTLMGFTEEMRQRGLQASSKLLEAGLRPGTVAELDALSPAQGPLVVSIRRVRLADDIPIALEQAVLPSDCAEVLTADLERSLHAALTAIGRVPSLAQSWITADVARRKEAEYLQIAPRSALLVERRLIYDAEGKPLEDTETRYVAERYVLDAVFSVAPPGTARRIAPGQR